MAWSKVIRPCPRSRPLRYTCSDCGGVGRSVQSYWWTKSGFPSLCAKTKGHWSIVLDPSVRSDHTRACRPNRCDCWELNVARLVACGHIRPWMRSGVLAQILGPGNWREADLHIMTHETGGVIHVFEPENSYVQLVRRPVKIPPYGHWMFECGSCHAACRVLLLPPSPWPRLWACLKCLKPRRPDRRRTSTLPPAKDHDLFTEMRRSLDVLERSQRLLALDEWTRRPDLPDAYS
jgi:hypothetical protein